jgi:hypothetical protein
MKCSSSFITSALALVACILFLWMFFAASTLERTAELGRISAPPGQDARAVAYEYAAKWRHGMAGNSPVYMPGFFAAAIAIWFWCAGRSLPRMLAEGAILISAAAVCAALLAPFAAPRILADFVAQEGFTVSHSESSGTWLAFAQGIYSLLTWSTVIIASRWSITLRSPKPLLIPLALNLVLAFVRPWTVADFTSRWMSLTLDGVTAAVISFLLVPIMSGFMAWVELRSKRSKARARRAGQLTSSNVKKSSPN